MRHLTRILHRACAPRVRRAGRGWRRVACASVLALAVPCAGFAQDAQEVSAAEMHGLDEQVQEIKSDVLAIAAELRGLEEKLLHPSDTQVSIFVAIGSGELAPDEPGARTSDLAPDAPQLDAVEIHLDGRPVARHVYSYGELVALQKGGVQRVYTGNVARGEHRLEVVVVGRSASGEDFVEQASLTFAKNVGPEVVGVTLTGGGGAPRISLGPW